jgi:protein-S-isoprenylcysteine O-methyltransferase Ste14
MRLVSIEPPVYLFGALAVIVVSHLFFPATRLIPGPWNLLGIFPLAAGINLNLVADRAFREARTSVKPLGETQTLLTDGAFRVSRHPMYLGFVLILLGAAALAGSLSPFFVVLVFSVFMDTVFIRFEEKKFERTFGKAWSDYRTTVRRWI